MVHLFLKMHGFELIETMKEIQALRRQEGIFNPGHFIWQYKDDVATFWKTASSFAPIIGPMALRLVSIPSNSVPCKRSFLVLKLLQNKFRSRIRSDRVDILQYIYINRRVFDKITAEHAARRARVIST